MAGRDQTRGAIWAPTLWVLSEWKGKVDMVMTAYIKAWHSMHYDLITVGTILYASVYNCYCYENKALKVNNE